MKKTINITLRLTDKAHERLKQLKKRSKAVSLTEVVRTALIQYEVFLNLTEGQREGGWKARWASQQTGRSKT